MPDKAVGRGRLSDAEAGEREVDPIYGGYQEGQRAVDGWTVFEADPGYACANCARVPRLLTSKFYATMRGEPLPCPACGAALDLWQQLREPVTPGRFMYVEHLVGVRATVARCEVRDDRPLTVNLESFGIPDDAMLFEVRTHTQPDPHEWGRLPLPPLPLPPFLQAVEEVQPQAVRHRLPMKLQFSTRATGSEPLGGQLTLQIAWMSPFTDKPEWQRLAEAFYAWRSGDPSASIIWASSAVELRLHRFIFGALQDGGISRDRSNSFLVDRATFGSQWEVVLPLIVHLRQSIRLDDEIRARIGELRRFRNRVAHGEVRTLSHRQLTRLLVACTFALHYLELVDPAS